MTYSTTNLKLSLLFCLAVLVPTVVQAQYNFYTSSTFYANQNTYPQFDYRAMHNSSQSQKKSSTQTQPSRDTESTSPSYFVKAKSRASADNNPLPYSRAPALSAKLREEFLTNFAKNTPNTAEAMRTRAQENDLVQLMAGFIQLQGLDSGSIENLLAIWHGQAWAIAHSKPLPTAKQYQAIAAQVRSQFDKSSYFKNMDNAKRQTFFEQLAYPLFLERAKYTGYLREGQSQTLSLMASNTQEGFKKMRLDLQNLQLTSRGLVPL